MREYPFGVCYHRLGAVLVKLQRYLCIGLGVWKKHATCVFNERIERLTGQLVCDVQYFRITNQEETSTYALITEMASN